jgi:hypothetical protein
MKNTKTMMIKSKFSNAVHNLLNPNPVKNGDKWKVKTTPLTNDEKVALFDQIVQLDKEISWELGSYWYNRREVKRRDKARAERGWKPKEKIPKKVQE